MTQTPISESLLYLYDSLGRFCELVIVKTALLPSQANNLSEDNAT